MTQLPSVTHSPATPQPVAAPLASMADRPFAYVLRGLVEAQLARSSAMPSMPSGTLDPASVPVVRPGGPSVIVGPDGPATVGAFALSSRVVAAAASDVESAGR
jgi:hypothetical protein